MNPFHTFVQEINDAIDKADKVPLGGVSARPQPEIAVDAPRALIFSPHPDDECVVGTLPLRLLREDGMKVINVAVTQGSRKDRQAERFKELQTACEFLGLGLIQTQPGGLERIKCETRENEPDYWDACVQIIAEILRKNAPAVIFLPHSKDWNGTHIGTHFLVMDALKEAGAAVACTMVETEYWQPMWDPNLMVECPPDLLADQIAGLTCHKGEIARNPYHLDLPAWMQDNVRRGSELVGGQGGGAADFRFAALYRVSRWESGGLQTMVPPQKLLAAAESPRRMLNI
mgnify:FL=1